MTHLLDKTALVNFPMATFVQPTKLTKMVKGLIAVFYSLSKSTQLPQDTCECLGLKRNLHHLQLDAQLWGSEEFQGKKLLENMHF